MKGRMENQVDSPVENPLGIVESWERNVAHPEQWIDIESGHRWIQAGLES